jgi:Hypervirulence associated proteins TUDOR domain
MAALLQRARLRFLLFKANAGTVAVVQKFKLNDHVAWNSEAGHVSGRVIKIHTKNVNYKGYTHHATEDDPQYEIKSDKTDHIALHRGAALKLVGR